MSRYEAELCGMATQLAGMVADPAIVANTTDVELVSRARLALRWWCRGMLHDVARFTTRRSLPSPD